MSNINELAVLKELVTTNSSKILLIVMDGVGGLRNQANPTTELEAAKTPNLDKIAARASLGRTLPSLRGMTVGSGPGHLALFGYNPLLPANDIGRGVLEAVGVDYKLKPSDVAARGNFVTLNAQGLIADRRAGRINTEEAKRICEKMQAAVREPIQGVQVRVLHVKEYRFCLVFDGPGLSGNLRDTDPQKEGVPVLPVKADEDTPEAKKTIAVVTEAVKRMLAGIADEPKANGFSLRGFAKDPGLETLEQRWKMRCAAIASYPLYRGVASLVGMDVLKTGPNIADEFATLREAWNKYDFFFLHIKKTDSNGEDGNRDGKIKIIEEVDAQLPILDELKPDVLMIAGDHSTPPPMKSHSFHPVPFLLAAKHADIDDGQRFTERECDKGTFGVFPATDIMQLALAHAGRLQKFGA